MPVLDRTHIEILHGDFPRGRIRCAMFDFDGTLSLIRAGWQEVMVSLMVEGLMQAPRREGEAELRTLVTGFVDRLTGQQTIVQMERFAEEVARRGGPRMDPLAFKHEYVTRLLAHIRHRLAGLRSGGVAPDDLLVPGAREFLEALRRRGVTCYLASGTDEPYVRDEAAALGLAPYFSGIYGARQDDARPIKQVVVEQILRDHGLSGPELVAFGDGAAEIECARRAGGLAVGVASDEAARRGIDAGKRQRLIRAGAQVVVPDFRDHAVLAAYLFAEN